MQKDLIELLEDHRNEGHQMENRLYLKRFHRMFFRCILTVYNQCFVFDEVIKGFEKINNFKGKLQHSHDNRISGEIERKIIENLKKYCAEITKTGSDITETLILEIGAKSEGFEKRTQDSTLEEQINELKDDIEQSKKDKEDTLNDLLRDLMRKFIDYSTEKKDYVAVQNPGPNVVQEYKPKGRFG